ncbi:hypothetical protein [Candidatus Lariskella endosymbiont of Hedychridium roseum]|uniref:hypothetical protein n=1 Tax=Candidatus Lariskella endosymbiont of Hedychridium roseum TaxID=3077949 RepID=UPI0030CED995
MAENFRQQKWLPKSNEALASTGAYIKTIGAASNNKLFMSTHEYYYVNIKKI